MPTVGGAAGGGAGYGGAYTNGTGSEAGSDSAGGSPAPAARFPSDEEDSAILNPFTRSRAYSSGDAGVDWMVRASTYARLVKAAPTRSPQRG